MMAINNIFSRPGKITQPAQPAIAPQAPTQAPDPMLGTPPTPKAPTLPAPNWRRGVSGMDRVGMQQPQPQRPQAWQDRLSQMQGGDTMRPMPQAPQMAPQRLQGMPQAPQMAPPVAPQQPQDYAALREALMGMRR